MEKNTPRDLNSEPELSGALTDKLPAKDAFRVPEGYFEVLTHSVMENIPNETNIHLVKTGYRKNRLYKIALPLAAASVIYLLVIIEWPRIKTAFQSKQISAVHEKATYKENDNYLFDEDHFDDLIVGYELTPVAEIISSDATFTEDSIIDYLTQNEMEDSLLAEL